MLLHLDFGAEAPIYQQIRNQIVLFIAQGRLQPGQRLPTVRALAEECGVNTMTVSKAYQQLRQEGYICTDRRTGTVVCARQNEAAPRPETLEGLRLRLSELRLAGVGEEEALVLCRRFYREGDANEC